MLTCDWSIKSHNTVHSLVNTHRVPRQWAFPLHCVLAQHIQHHLLCVLKKQVNYLLYKLFLLIKIISHNFFKIRSFQPKPHLAENVALPAPLGEAGGVVLLRAPLVHGVQAAVVAVDYDALL